MVITANLNCKFAAVQKIAHNYSEKHRPVKGDDTQSSQKLSYNKTSYYKAIQNKYNIYSPGFKGACKDTFSFEEFNNARREAGIYNLEDLKSNIKDKNIMGTGANSTVYAFDNPQLDNWVLKVDKKPFHNPCSMFIEKTEDKFGGQNMGQEIAKAGDRYHILKKIKGDVHSVVDWSYHINNNSQVTPKEAQYFLATLQNIASFPQSSFDDYAFQLKTLGEKGYKQDSINPNNILIDYNKKKIHIIDSFKAVDPSHVNSRLDLINVLLDFALFNSFYNNLESQNRKALIEASEKIIEKCNIASQKEGLPQDEETYIKYLSNVDKYFGYALVDKGGDYRSRYFKMKTILPDIA